MSQPLLRPKLKAPSSVPYGGEFKLNLPELGFVGKGTTFDMLERNIREYRKANALPNGLGLCEELEREVCKAYPDECFETDVSVPDTSRRLGWGDVLAGTEVLAKFKLSGHPLVSQEEANRRAEICSKCGWNLDYSRPCGFTCGALKDLVLKIVGSAATPFDDQLRSCMICKCFGAAQVWIPLEDQTQGLTEDQKAKFKSAVGRYGCWKGANL